MTATVADLIQQARQAARNAEQAQQASKDIAVAIAAQRGPADLTGPVTPQAAYP